MNTRQWKLYNLIKENSEMGKPTTQQEICNKIEGYVYKDRRGTTDQCSAIWNDVRDINASSDTDKLIITNKYRYWIGTELETAHFLNQYWESIAPALSRYWAMVKKVKNNGQYKLLSNRGVPITQTSKARLYVESYIEKEIEEEIEKMSPKEQFDYYRAKYLKLGGYPIKLTLEEYKEEVKKLEASQSKN